MINSRSLDDLHPLVKPRMVSFLARAAMALSEQLVGTWSVIPTCTLRDDEYQAQLYAQGRTIPGNIVTNAKPGDSVHQFGMAMDFAIKHDGQITWEKEFFQVCGHVAIEEGLTWGGDWNANGVMDKADWDLAHVQWTGGLTLAQLKAGETLA